MRSRRERAKGRREKGSFVAMPHVVLKHENFADLSPRATKLLMDFCAEYVGNNNGDFCATWKTMKKRGWKSKGQLYKAIKELIEIGFILKTRQGGTNKCCLYAITIWPIDDCDGKLELRSTKVAPGDWKN